MAAQTVYPIARHTSVSGTNVDEYFPSGGSWANTKGATSVVFTTTRYAETGTCTMQVFGEWYDEGAAAWRMWLDYNNATQIQGVQYADGSVDYNTDPKYQMVAIHEGALAVDADYVVVLNTIHKLYQAWIPERVRFRIRHGGTTVTNNWSGNLFVHTAR